MYKILVIGNGYDIAHGLKTRYSDFIGFIKEKKYEKPTGRIESELSVLVETNPFLQYLVGINSSFSMWVDLEQEMLRLTKAIEKSFVELDNNPRDITFRREYFQSLFNFIQLSNFQFLSVDKQFSPPYLIRSQFRDEYGSVIWPAVKKQMRDYLNGLKKALSIYLSKYMPLYSNDSNSLIIPQIRDLNPDSIISFNYTETYSRYGYCSTNVCHIHGRLTSDNIVLGYEDDNPDDLRMVYFKKYFQRIQNKTDSLSKALSNIHDEVVAYFYGLSLDITDKDAITEIYKKSSRCNFFYCDQDDYERKVMNLIAILGKEKFLKDYATNKILFSEIREAKNRVSYHNGLLAIRTAITIFIINFNWGAYRYHT